MKVSETEFEGLYIVESHVFQDERGTFNKSWVKAELSTIVQDNCEMYISHSKKGVFRGLHYQRGGRSQGKYISCISGRIKDVAVDLRKKSSTYSKVFTIDLVGMSGLGVYIPKGFAHGFFSYDESLIVNICDSDYSPGDEECISWDSIAELENLNVTNISEKDKAAKTLGCYLNENSNWS